MRTLHHIEHRACIGYIEGANICDCPFARAHYGTVTGFSMFQSEIWRWIYEPAYKWFCLPTHELAELHHTRSLIMFLHLYEYSHRLASDGLLNSSIYNKHNLVSQAISTQRLGGLGVGHGRASFAAHLQVAVEDYIEEGSNLVRKVQPWPERFFL